MSILFVFGRWFLLCKQHRCFLECIPHRFIYYFFWYLSMLLLLVIWICWNLVFDWMLLVAWSFCWLGFSTSYFPDLASFLRHDFMGHHDIMDCAVALFLVVCTCCFFTQLSKKLTFGGSGPAHTNWRRVGLWSWVCDAVIPSAFRWKGFALRTFPCLLIPATRDKGQATANWYRGEAKRVYNKNHPSWLVSRSW